MAVLPPPTQDIYLVDDANMVEPEDRQKILAMGRELDQKTGAQVVVVTMNTLGPESIENYANKLFRKWGIGDRKKNNGVLLLIAKEDRKFRIEVGYGLEGAITDGYAGNVLDGMKSDFRGGKYSSAILATYGKLTKKAYEAENMAAPESVSAAVASTNAASSTDEDDEEWTWPEILLGVPLGLIMIGLLLWCLWQMLYLVWMVFALLLFLAGFERRELGTRRMILVSVMTALSVLGRMLPVIKPITALTVLSAMYLGPEAGFLTGALSAVLSNFIMGQGPWTPFQMLAWGLIGLFAGLLAKPLRRSRLLLYGYGLLSGAAYSMIMDIWTTVWTYGEFTLRQYGAAVVSSMPYPVVYAASNVIFLMLLAKPFGDKLARIGKKYGL